MIDDVVVWVAVPELLCVPEHDDVCDWDDVADCVCDWDAEADCDRDAEPEGVEASVGDCDGVLVFDGLRVCERVLVWEADTEGEDVDVEVRVSDIVCVAVCEADEDCEAETELLVVALGVNVAAGGKESIISQCPYLYNRHCRNTSCRSEP